MSIQISYPTTGSTTPDLVLGWEQRSSSPAIVQDIIGGGVHITTVAARPRTGTLRLFYLYESAAADAFTAHQQDGMFTVTDLNAPGSWKEMRYIVGEGGCSITLDEITRNRWIVEVDYQELQPA